MYFFYSILLSIGFVLMSPFFILRREKYASGFQQRLGNYPQFQHDGRKVIWLHCVSVGETNAARPLVQKLSEEFADHRLVISTTTRTGHELAHKLFSNTADAIVYFPFDFKFSVRRALRHFNPSLVLLMETEIWPRFIHEAKLSGAKVAIVNGRLSARSLRRYARVRPFVQKVLDQIDLALMQDDADAARIRRLGINPVKVTVTGNLKFQQTVDAGEARLTEEFRSRFALTVEKPLIVAASTHDTEEEKVIEALEGELGRTCRLLIAPRHPERFDVVARLLGDSGYSFVRRSAVPSPADSTADIVLLDSIGELRAVYSLAEIVFVGGSLIPHGGQSVLEPAAEGKAIITGPHTHNFDAAIREFRENNAIRQLPASTDNELIQRRLHDEFSDLLDNPSKRHELGRNADGVMSGANRDATDRTIACLGQLLRNN